MTRVKFQYYLLLSVALFVLSGCIDEQVSGQSVAKVDDVYITEHQYNALLTTISTNQQQPVSPKLVATKLIDQEIAIQSAVGLKLDRRPEVLQRLELAKREILAGAYAEHIAQGLVAPSYPEIEAYYNDNPLLFEDRKIFQLNVLRLPLILRENREFVDVLKKSSQISELQTWVSKQNISFVSGREIRAAEQLPITALSKLNDILNDGKSVFETDADIVIYEVEAASSAPLSLTQARTSISRYMLNQRTKRELALALAASRDQRSIELYGKFAELLGPANAK